MKYVKGDLIKLAQNGDFDVIVHGCNCFNTMGAGIAKQIKSTFPEAYQIDLSTLRGDLNKLGTISFTEISRYDKPFIVVNAYTQFNYGVKQISVNYNAISSCFKIINNLFPGKKIGIPRIGAGLAGGDWNIISNLIEEETSEQDLYVITYKN